MFQCFADARDESSYPCDDWDSVVGVGFVSVPDLVDVGVILAAFRTERCLVYDEVPWDRFSL